MKKLRLLVPALLATSLLVAACGGDDNDEAPASVADGVTEVVRQVLAETDPETAQGQVLELTRVIVPVDEALPAHTHPGPQLAVIAQGTLTYTIIDGEVTVTRAAGTDSQKVETYGTGDTVELREGDTVSETPNMQHEAANEGDEPIVIYLSSLFPEGAPPATNVE